MTHFVYRSDKWQVGQMVGRTNVGRTNVDRTNVGRTKLAAPWLLRLLLKIWQIQILKYITKWTADHDNDFHNFELFCCFQILHIKNKIIQKGVYLDKMLFTHINRNAGKLPKPKKQVVEFLKSVRLFQPCITCWILLLRLHLIIFIVICIVSELLSEFLRPKECLKLFNFLSTVFLLEFAIKPKHSILRIEVF